MRYEDTEKEQAFELARKDQAKVAKWASVKKLGCGLALVVGGIVYAFQFEAPIGFLVAAVGGGILAVKDVKSFLGK